MKSLFAVLIVFLSASSIPALAQERACTEIGCVNGLTLSVDPGRPWEKGNYDFVFVIDGRAVMCRGELPLKKCEDGRSFTCNKPGVMISESGCALPESAHALGDIQISGAPKKVMIRITHDNNPFVTRTISPSYTTSAPNGPECGPICRSASQSLFIAP